MSRDTDAGQYYIVMEFVEGGNLREILQHPQEARAGGGGASIIEDAAGGLAYAYSRGVTHRDMKLTNMLISSQGVAKLVDFGLAQIFAAMAGYDEEKVDRTVDYAGLEKATGVTAGDVRSDIYFLGCVLYEMLTGRPPLDMTRDKHARMHQQRFDNVKPLRPRRGAGAAVGVPPRRNDDGAQPDAPLPDAGAAAGGDPRGAPRVEGSRPAGRPRGSRPARRLRRRERRAPAGRRAREAQGAGLPRLHRRRPALRLRPLPPAALRRA